MCVRLSLKLSCCYNRFIVCIVHENASWCFFRIFTSCWRQTKNINIKLIIVWIGFWLLTHMLFLLCIVFRENASITFVALYLRTCKGRPLRCPFCRTQWAHALSHRAYWMCVLCKLYYKTHTDWPFVTKKNTTVAPRPTMINYRNSRSSDMALNASVTRSE